MDNSEYSEKAISFDRNYETMLSQLESKELPLLHGALGIAGEAGELVDAIKKHVLYKKELDKENVVEECGDILWYMNLLLKTVGSSFEEAMAGNVDKLSKRYPNGYNHADAIARKDKADAQSNG